MIGSSVKKYLLIVGLLSCTGLHAAEPKKRVALMDFDYGTVQHWWQGNWDVGKGIADLVVTNLVKDGSLSVIERKKLDTILSEQNFSNSDRANPTTAAKIGKVLGVNAIIVGSITQFGMEDKSMKIGGIGGSWGRLAGGAFGKKEGKATVVIDARVVDVNTGEILAVASGKGVSKRSGLLLGGVGAGGGGFGAGGIDMGSSNFQDTILGEATRTAVTDLTTQIIAQAGKVEVSKIVINGLIADVSGGTIILNLGKNAGVSTGMTLQVERVTREVKDPASGKVLRKITTVVGEVEVTEVDEGSSVARTLSGSGFKVGDVVKSK
ncbi:MAG: curli production assembly protein CsgG [Acidobacteria bacterium]|nr:curli production assembly protein CsgG [Acidobacteriota bacterium]MBI3657597.1 curli production assembly protein CsgG [Acidobacteriota bacterium]